jgi:hypothetical protein
VTELPTVSSRIATLQEAAALVVATLRESERRSTEGRAVLWDDGGKGFYVQSKSGDPVVPGIMSVIYQDGDHIVARRSGYMYVYEVLEREQGGAAHTVRKLFVFDPDWTERNG